MKKNGNKRGSLMIGILLMMLVISAISIAIINRSKHGAILATDSRKGYVAYQSADSETEKILNDIRELDENTDSTIPENTRIDAYCIDNCYAQDGTSELGNANRVKDIFFLQKKETAQSMTRAIKVPVPDRVGNPVKAMTVSGCLVTLDLWPGLMCDEISGFEVRSSNVGNLTAPNQNWKKVGSLDCDDSDVVDGQVNIIIIGTTAGEKITVKAKNKKPFNLDSLYYYETPLTPIGGC